MGLFLCPKYIHIYIYILYSYMEPLANLTPRSSEMWVALKPKPITLNPNNEEPIRVMSWP